MPLRALIFDLDGTLIDSLADIGGAMNHALKLHGFPEHPLPAYRQFVGEGAQRLAERAIPADRLGEVDSVLRAYRSYYADHALDHTRPYAGVPEALDAFVARGLSLAVLSNKPEPATRALTRALFSRWPFAPVHGERPDVPRKPDPAPALAIADQFGLAPAEIGFVGDTAVDMDTATRAGMIAIGCAWGLRDRAELEAARARVILERAHELPAAVFRFMER